MIWSPTWTWKRTTRSSSFWSGRLREEWVQLASRITNRHSSNSRRNSERLLNTTERLRQLRTSGRCNKCLRTNRATANRPRALWITIPFRRWRKITLWTSSRRDSKHGNRLDRKYHHLVLVSPLNKRSSRELLLHNLLQILSIRMRRKRKLSFTRTNQKVQLTTWWATLPQTTTFQTEDLMESRWAWKQFSCTHRITLEKTLKNNKRNS